MHRILYIIPLVVIVSLVSGCLTTMAISAIAGQNNDSGSGSVNSAKETARDVADKARETADDISLSAHDAIESLGGGS
jgi:hypothetical protein